MGRYTNRSYGALQRLFIYFVLILHGVNCQFSTFSTTGCGQVDESIAKLDKRASAPWIATVFYQSSQCDFRPGGFGNAVIIGPTTILMSGNFLWKSKKGVSDLFAFQPNGFMVAVGLKSKLLPLQADSYTQFIKVENIQPHPKSNELHSEYDYAIVHLKNAIQFSSRVRPICLELLEKSTFNNLTSQFLQNGVFLTGFGYPRNEVQKNPFEFKDSNFCKDKVTDEYFKPQVSPVLVRAGSPCGIIPGTLVERQGVEERRLLVSNACYQKGAVLATYTNNRWHLVGLLAESLGYDCNKNIYFVSPVALKTHLLWILNNIKNSPHYFVCNNGQQINLKTELCNNFKDCDDGSDEDASYCQARRCKNFSQYCTSCINNDTFKIQRNTYNYSTSVASPEIRCPTIFPPQNIDVICEEQDLRERISCKDGGAVGSKAIFRCKRFDYSNPGPSSYCVVTCLDNGQWTDGLSQLKCEDKYNSAPQIEPDLISDRLNFTTWFEETIRLGIIKSTTTEAYTTIAATNTNISDSNSTPNECPGFPLQEGIRVTCRDPLSSKVTNCSGKSIVGTKAEFGCSRYYKPVLTSNSLVKTCGSNGQWTLSNRNFDCRLDCGLPKSYLVGHIVNGAVSDEANWPWHAILFIKTKSSSYTYICGATLISKKTLLTAAHCVTNRNGKPMEVDKYKIIMGAASSVFEENISDPHSQVFEITSSSINPVFNHKTFEADIAIIQINKPVEITDYVRPACFPTSATIHNELLHTSPGSSGYIVGFGYDEHGMISKIMKEAKLPVVSYSECYRVLNIQPSATMYCAGYTNGTSACSGDSGGGHFFSDEVHPNRLFLQGIISHGNSDKGTRLCDHNQYTVFTKVASFKEWIFEQGLELDEEF